MPYIPSRKNNLEQLLIQNDTNPSSEEEIVLPKKETSPKKLLDSYLQSDKNSSHSIRLQVKQLGSLEKLLPNASVSTAPKQLGSLQEILRGKSANQTFTDNAAPPNLYENKDLFQEKHKSSAQDTQAFSNKKAVHYNPYKNLSLIVLGVFGLGASIFGIDQFIKNANLNFASEGDQNQNVVKPPRILAFQGRLSDINQNSVVDTKNMRFEMYNTSGGNAPPPIGGEILWDSGFCQILPNQSGVFSVNLGAGTGQNQDKANCGSDLGNIFAENSNIWLQITVEEEVLFPRQLIKSVPFALNSETLQGFPASQSATPNTIPVLDSQGNLNFATNNTSLINLGQLNLISKEGDIHLLPGAGNVYIGSHDNPANLFVTGDATVAGSLNLATKPDSEILYGENGLTFKSQAGKDVWKDQLTLTNEGFLGLGTDKPSQKLTLNQGSIGFDFSDGPNISKMQASEDVTNLNALTKIASPTRSLSYQTLEQGESKLSKGQYKYAYTFVTVDGAQTGLSPLSAYSTELNNRPVLITDIATHPQENIVARNIYRTKNGGSEFFFLKQIDNNTATTAIDDLNDSQLNQAATNLNDTGSYRYKMTFVTPDGETNPSSATNPVKISGDGRVIKLSDIPLAPLESQVTTRKIYRSLANSEKYYLVATISDNTTTIFDNLNDKSLATQPSLQTSGSVYTNGKLSLQFNADGSIISHNQFTANGRVETAHGDNQGLKIPTSIGKPFVKTGQKAGDIVYDSVGQVLYIYNGYDFVATGLPGINDGQSASSSNCTGNLCRLVLDPEYAGAVFTGDGTDNNGLFSSGSETLVNSHRLNYYQWISSEVSFVNDFDTTINLTLPQNFSSWQENGISLDFITQTTNPSDNFVDLEVFRGGSTVNASRLKQVSSKENTWMSHSADTQPLSITAAELTNLGFSPGDTLTIKIKTSSKSNNLVKIGQINLNYLTKDGVTQTGTQSVWKQLAGAIMPSNPNSDLILGGDSTASAKIAMLNLGGVGTPTLHVRGNLFLDNPESSNYLDLASQSSFNIRTLNEQKTPTQRFTILPNGNIGIGVSNPTEKLEVDGNIKANGTLQLTPMSAAEAGECVDSAEGKLYYDQDQLKFFACQANDQARSSFSWRPLN